MSTAIPPHKRLEVVKLYFEGLSYDDIVEKTGVAKGTVAAIVEALKVGEFPQFEHVADMVNELRDLTVGLRKAGVDITEAAPLLILVKKLLGLGVEPPHLESWVRMCRAVPEREFSRSLIIQAASKLAKLEQEGLSYDQTMESLTTSSVELKRLEGELAELRAEEAKLHGRKEELTQANHHLEAESTRLQGKLNAMAVKEKEQEDRLQELGEQVKQFQEEMAQLETEKNKLGRETSQLQERALVLEKQVTDKTETLRNLDEVSFPRHHLGQLRDRLNEIAQRHGKDDVATRFFAHLNNYDSLLEMEGTKDKLTMEIESLAKQRDSLAELGKKWELAADDITQGIAALKAVSRKGVSPAVIISYQRALTEAGTDPPSFQQLVAEFGGLEQVLAARRGELKGLAEALETKARALEELKAEEAKIKESISTLRNAAVKHIQGTVHSATSEVKKLCQALSADIMKWGEVRAEMGKCENELKLARCFAQLPLSDEALSSLVEDISIPIVTQYLTIALVWCQTKLNLKLRPPRAILKKYYTISEYTDVELTDIITWALLAFMEGMGNVKRGV